jgi:cation diffusion facilitator CzcD-associated flavoprotein CzcO
MKKTKRDVSVAIIGAGLGGIAAAVHAKRAGVTSLTIFEQSGGRAARGGTTPIPASSATSRSRFTHIRSRRGNGIARTLRGPRSKRTFNP